MDENEQHNPAPKAALTPAQVTEKMSKWAESERELARWKAEEMALRQVLFAHFFPKPREGTNTADLAEGWKIKGQYKINRKLDEPALPACFAQLPAGVQDAVLKWVPEISMTAYKEQPPEVRSILDTVIISKPGAPSLEFVPPKSKAAPTAA